MDIITRNFFRLLRSGAFNEDVSIEPMSYWKWKCLYQNACLHGIHGILADGIDHCREQFFLMLPEDLVNKWKDTVATLEAENDNIAETQFNLYRTLRQHQFRPVLIGNCLWAESYPKPEHHQNLKIEFFFPSKQQFDKAYEWVEENGENITVRDNGTVIYDWNGVRVEHYPKLHTLTNKYLNFKLNSIVEQEFHDNAPTFMNEDTEILSNELSLFLILLRFSYHLLNNCISIKNLCDLSIFLRTEGSKVDYAKLNKWIATLRMKSIANIVGALLVELFHFSYDELPFVTSTKSDIEPLLKDLYNVKIAETNSWYFKQGKDIFVHANNSSAMMWHVRHSGKYFKYYPSESITNFVSSFARSLSQIEE